MVNWQSKIVKFAKGGCLFSFHLFLHRLHTENIGIKSTWKMIKCNKSFQFVNIDWWACTFDATLFCCRWLVHRFFRFTRFDWISFDLCSMWKLSCSSNVLHLFCQWMSVHSIDLVNSFVSFVSFHVFHAFVFMFSYFSLVFHLIWLLPLSSPNQHQCIDMDCWMVCFWFVWAIYFLHLSFVFCIHSIQLTSVCFVWSNLYLNAFNFRSWPFCLEITSSRPI